MNIVCIVQVYNEIVTGHLKEFFDENSALFDGIVVYDDGSTDGSYEYCLEKATKVIRSASNDFKKELRHKKQLITEAEDLGAEFIVSLDADEILVMDREKLESYCRWLAESGVDAISVDFINLWRSSNYKRVDSLFDEYKPVKIWKHKPGSDPYPNIVDKLHQPLHPQYLENIVHRDDVKLLHTGFSTEERILRKFLVYRAHGQRGFELMRFIDESDLKLEKVPGELLPDHWKKNADEPKPNSIQYYIEKSYRVKERVFKPKYSIVCLIYKDVNWLEFVYRQVQKYTNLDDKEFFFVANDASDEVKEYLKSNYIPHYVLDNTEEQRNEHYINNVYRAYNYGVDKSKGDFVVLINSDMAFSEGWFESLLARYDGTNCVASRLVEAGKLAPGKYGLAKNFGNDFSDYDEPSFIAYANTLKENKALDSGLYMPLFVRKSHFESVGGYPEGNIVPGSDVFNPEIATPGQQVVSGDTAFIEKLASNGISHITAFDSIVYHFQEGEKRGVLMDSVFQIPNEQVVICNDILTGTMGEKVLWDFLLTLPKSLGLGYSDVGGRKSFSFTNYMSEKSICPSVLLQNATFMDRVAPDQYTVAFLQDDLRLMGRPSSQQEYNLASSDRCVTNSFFTASSYPEFDFDIIPVGVDSELFTVKDKESLREKWEIITDKKVGIFVGALDEVKGWPKVKSIIERRDDLEWIVVTKYHEKYAHPRVHMFNRVDQETLSELLNCADFFVLGTAVETQCLAAIEAALCDLPIVMRRTGIFVDINDNDLKTLGCFGDDLEKGIDKVLGGSYAPRATMLKYPITVDHSLTKWHNLFSDSKMRSDNRRYCIYKNAQLSQDRKIDFKYKLEFFVRKKIFQRLIGRDNFFSVAEISVFVKRNMPAPVFSVLRKTWRFLNRG
ncbi:MAG: glycosyltransferase [Bacteroidetes bacterium]|nr:MAG: glycosyltransferase [Bacteroidota bacterium]